MLCGDCDNNYFVNILDALRASQVSSGLATATAVELRQCDVYPHGNPDGRVTVLDALLIARYVVGLEPALQCS